MKAMFQRDGVLTIVIVAALSAGFLWGFYLPERRAAEAVRKEITTLEGSIGRIPVRVAELESLEREISAREEFVKNSESWMPRHSRVSTVLEHVTQLARNAQLTVTRLEPRTPEPAKSYRKLPFRITFQGRFAGIAAFLKGLESHGRTVTFDEVSLKLGEADGSPSTQADLHFSVFAEGPDFADSAGNNARRNDPTADIRQR